MTELENVINVESNDYIIRVRSNLASNNINASHRTERSLRVEKYNDGFRVVIGGDRTAPAESLQTGNPPSFVPADILLQWLADKGLPADKSFAYAIQKKIAREGTVRWRQYGRNGSYLNIYTDEGEKTQRSLQNKINEVFTKLIITKK